MVMDEKENHPVSRYLLTLKTNNFHFNDLISPLSCTVTLHTHRKFICKPSDWYQVSHLAIKIYDFQRMPFKKLGWFGFLSFYLCN